MQSRICKSFTLCGGIFDFQTLSEIVHLSWLKFFLENKILTLKRYQRKKRKRIKE